MTESDTRLQDGPTSPQSGGATQAERRGATRYPFTAAAEIIELRSGVRLSARTTDISQGGCYVDTMTPFACATPVKARLVQGGRSFEAKATVRYSQQGMGMGLQFTEVSPASTQVLGAWLAELGGQLAPVFGVPEIASSIQQFSRSDRYILSKLISLLIRKRILDEHEGAQLLRELTA